MTEWRDRLGELRSRFDLRDEKTQLTLASIAAVLVLVVAVVALPPSDDTGPAATGAVESGPEAEVRTRPGAKPGRDASTEGRGPGGETVPGGPIDEGGAAAPGAPPVRATAVKIGITYVSNPGGANAAAGFSVAQVDQRRGWEAMVKDVNRDPPFGRKVVPVWYSQTEEEIQSKGLERIGQEACAHFTQDNKVFMVWVGTLGAGVDTLSACLTKAKVPQINFGIGGSYSKTFNDFPYLVEPTAAAMDRMAAFYVDELYDAGFFAEFKDNSPPYSPTKPADGKPKVALIRYDEPSHKAGAVALKRRLAAHKLSLCSGCEFEIAYSPDNVPAQLDDAGEINAAIQNCKSRPGGPCTHMLLLGNASQRIPVFFIDGAEKQQYRPRIGFSPLDSWTFVRDFLAGSTDAQFRQSQLVTYDPGDFGVTTEAFGRCKKLFEDAGETFESSESTDGSTMIPPYCDTAWYHVAAMKAAGPALNLGSWMNGVDTMKPVPSAGTYRMQTKRNRHDGIGAIRIGEWSDACRCFKPASGVIPV